MQVGLGPDVRLGLGRPAGGGELEGEVKACGMNTAVLPTTWAGDQAPLPLTTTWIVCPSSQVAGNVRLFLALIGSATAPWARAASIRIRSIALITANTAVDLRFWLAARHRG
jgi:hypothetical protein